MITSIGRRLTHVVSVGLLLSLAACTGAAPPLPADGAVSHYEDVATELAAAMAVDGTAWVLAPKTRKVTADEESCLYTPGTWTPEELLPAPPDEDSWEPRITAVNPVLSQYGFEEIDSVTPNGGRVILKTTDEYGATVTITPEGEVRIWGARVDADPCTAATLGIE